MIGRRYTPRPPKFTRGRRAAGPVSPVAAPGDALGSVDRLLALPSTDAGHYKAAMSAGLSSELGQVRASVAGELSDLDDEIGRLRAQLAAADAALAECQAELAAAEAASAGCSCGGA